MLSTSKNFLFIHVPKTGGNSIQKALLPFSDDHLALVGPHHDGIDRFEIRSPAIEIHKHSTLQDYRRQLDPDFFARLTKVTCVRNPWDRCVSFFFSPHRGKVEWSPDEFERFITQEIQPHSHYLSLVGQDSDPFDNFDTILKFERLEDDFRDLCRDLDLGEVSLPRVNVSDRTHYRSYFPTDRLVNVVAEKFSSEIKLFGYEF